MQISENFKLSEFTNSKTADKKKIDNTPSPSERANIYTLVNEILQPIRSKFGKSIKVNSGFRCKNLNKAVFGSSTSQHLTGSAADITSSDNKELFELIIRLIKEGKIVVGQLINEYNYSWIHISLPNANKVNQILEAIKLSNGTLYKTVEI